MQQIPRGAHYPDSLGQNPQQGGSYQQTPHPQAKGLYPPPFYPQAGRPYQPSQTPYPSPNGWYPPPYYPPTGGQYRPPQPPYSPNTPYRTPPPPRKSHKGWEIAVTVVGVLLAISIIISVEQPWANSTNTSPAPAQTQAVSAPQRASTSVPPPVQPAPTSVSQQAPAQASNPAPTPPAFAQFTDGTYTVGQDIQPGTYRTQQASPGCYFARLRGFSGTLGDIIANKITDYPAIVTIASTDQGFQSTNCGSWTSDLSAITSSQTSFPDGMYIIGTDIQPGTYKSSGQTGCYYARLSGFGGSINEILANNVTDAAAIVTISASDQGFESQNCGNWTMQ